MCKFIKPSIPANATIEEKQQIMFEALNSLDLSGLTEKRDNGLTYLSWSNAWSEFKSAYPDASFRVIRTDTGLPFFADPSTGIFVFTEITAGGTTHQMFLPVMNGANKAMKLEPYTYQAWDTNKRQYVEKTVAAATSFDINKALMRCLTKNIALFGLGLYLYSGDDLPSSTSSDNAPTSEPKPAPKPVDRFASIKNAISKANDIPTLMTLYLDHQNEVESNQAIKELFTAKRIQIQSTQKH